MTVSKTNRTPRVFLETVMDVIHPLLHCCFYVANPKCTCERRRISIICFECRKEKQERKESEKRKGEGGMTGKKQSSQLLQVVARKPEVWRY